MGKKKDETSGGETAADGETAAEPEVHPTEQLVRDAHAVLKRGLDAYDRRGVGHAPNIDDVRFAFKALDAVLEGVDHG